MRSVEMTKETYAGIPADALAFTPADESVWFESKDIQCLPAILATLKGLRAAISVTKLTASLAAVSVVAGESVAVSSEYTPAEAFQPVVWTTENAGIATVSTADDGINVVIKGVKAGTTKVKATGGGQSAMINVTVA